MLSSHSLCSIPVVKLTSNDWTSILFDVKGKMIMQDKMEKERADSKNAVEEYVYEMRDKLSGALSEFMIEAVGSFLFVWRQIVHIFW